MLFSFYLNIYDLLYIATRSCQWSRLPVLVVRSPSLQIGDEHDLPSMRRFSFWMRVDCVDTVSRQTQGNTQPGGEKFSYYVHRVTRLPSNAAHCAADSPPRLPVPREYGFSAPWMVQLQAALLVHAART